METIHLVWIFLNSTTGNKLEVAEPPLHAHYAVAENRNRSKNTRSRKNDLFGVPCDVALVKYVEAHLSVEGIRQRYSVRFCGFLFLKLNSGLRA